MKTWDYTEVTDEAEHRIRQLMEAAKGKPGEEAQRLRHMPCGVYILWDGMTLFHRSSYVDDAFRLSSLLGPYQFQWRTELGLPADD